MSAVQADRMRIYDRRVQDPATRCQMGGIMFEESIGGWCCWPCWPSWWTGCRGPARRGPVLPAERHVMPHFIGHAVPWRWDATSTGSSLRWLRVGGEPPHRNAPRRNRRRTRNPRRKTDLQDLPQNGNNSSWPRYTGRHYSESPKSPPPPHIIPHHHLFRP